MLNGKVKMIESTRVLFSPFSLKYRRFLFFFSFLLETREKWERTGQREGNLCLFKIQSEFAGSRHGSRCCSIPRLLWTRGRLFPRPRERRQIISHISRASNDRFLFLPAPLHGVALFRIIIPALLDKIFRPMPLSTERPKGIIRWRS